MIILLLAVILTVLCFIVCKRTVIKPLEKTHETLQHIVDEISDNRGDLTRRIEVKGTDEVGQMGKGINEFIEALQRTMKSIISNSSGMLDASSIKTKFFSPENVRITLSPVSVDTLSLLVR